MCAADGQLASDFRQILRMLACDNHGKKSSDNDAFDQTNEEVGNNAAANRGSGKLPAKKNARDHRQNNPPA